MTGPAAVAAVRVRDLGPGDLDEVARLDGLHTGAPKAEYWRARFAQLLAPADALCDALRVGLGAASGERPGHLDGYLLGDVRAVEFGSEACGWVFAVGVEPRAQRERIASMLLAEACRRFREAGVLRVRTMVRRNDIPVLSFFRASGFVGGPFVQLELDLEETR